MSRAVNVALVLACGAGAAVVLLLALRRPPPALPATPEALSSRIDDREVVRVPDGWLLRGDTEAELRAVFSLVGKTAPPNEYWTALVRPDDRMRLVPGFFIDRVEVTNRRYDEFLAATGRRPPRIDVSASKEDVRVFSDWRDGRIVAGREDHPVFGISWHEASAFARWDGGRLPTEIEWERAARGDDGRTFPWGDQWDETRSLNAAWRLDDTLPVGGFPAGKSPFGCRDMAGSVWEWTASDFDLYPGNARQTGGEGGKAIRGGAFLQILAAQRCSVRIGIEPSFRTQALGFRTVRDGPRSSAPAPRGRSAPGRE